MAAADRNVSTLYAMPIDLFGRTETGWAVYAPRMAATVGAAAPADSPAFAKAVAQWRRRQGGPADGTVDAALLVAMKAGWQAQRPFFRLRRSGVCPDAPAPSALAVTRASESYGGRPIEVRAAALQAYRRMVRLARLARLEDPDLRRRPELLQIFSGYRSPERDALRCATQGDCQGVARASCSAHRTGLALDLVLDTAPGYAVDSSADANRLAMARGLTYRWLLVNAPRFGFVNYAFEPWHWEWTGAAP